MGRQARAVAVIAGSVDGRFGCEASAFVNGLKVCIACLVLPAAIYNLPVADFVWEGRAVSKWSCLLSQQHTHCCVVWA